MFEGDRASLAELVCVRRRSCEFGEDRVNSDGIVRVRSCARYSPHAPDSGEWCAPPEIPDTGKSHTAPRPTPRACRFCILKLCSQAECDAHA